MQNLKPFRLNFLRREKHLVLPTITSIVLTQNLYDILFQYVIDARKEALLQEFIGRLADHIKSKSRAPFSAPVEELAFLNEGLEELRLLNWMEVEVMVFSLELDEAADEEARAAILDELSTLMVVNAKPDTGVIFVYPFNII